VSTDLDFIKHMRSGDRVAVGVYNFMDQCVDYYISYAEPKGVGSGRTIEAHGLTFGPDGLEVLEPFSKRRPAVLCAVTDTIRAQVDRRRHLSRIKRADFALLDDRTLKAISDLIHERAIKTENKNNS
jgi:hypothetical protein